MEKSLLRRSLLTDLRGLSAAFRIEASREICRRIADDGEFRRAGVVFSFLPLPVEPDLRPLLEDFPAKTWGFPQVMDGEWMRFHHLMEPGEAIAGSHGLREPDPMVHPVIQENRADLVLVPGLGFDPETHSRIGRGRGYYDRYLSGYRGARHPGLIGIAFSCQLTRLVAEAHDVPVHRILTEEGWA